VQWRFLSWADAHVHDWFTRTLPQTSAQQPVMLIDIDERSLSAIGPWPWPRTVTAQIMQNLRERGAKLQVWDLFIADSNLANASLVNQINQAPDIVLGQVLILDPAIQNPPQTGQLRPMPNAPPICAQQQPTGGYLGVAPELQPTWVGHLSATPDEDGKLRRLPAVLCDQSARRYPQLAITSVQALSPQSQWEQQAGHPLWGPAQWLVRDNIKIPLDADGNLIIPYTRDHTAWSAISAYQLLQPDAALPSLQNHVVIIGASALGVGDIVSTPRHPNTPGVSIHSELIHAALHNNWLIEPRAPAVFAALLTLLSALLLLPLTQPQTRLTTILCYVSLFMLLPFMVALLARLIGFMLPVAVPTLSIMLFGFGLLVLKTDTERQRAQQLALHLESFLPASLAREIAYQAPSDESLGKLCQGVLLAVRVSGLERWTSSVDSLQALGLAHAISTVAEHVAQEQGGALEHVHGEIMLITWPQIAEQTANNALRTARQLVRKLEPVLRQNESVRYPISLQITLETGTFLLGLAGPHSSRRLLLLGPVVDAVQAMLPFCEELASQILVGRQLAELQSAEKLVSLGKFLLPDQAQPQTLYRVAQ
jgi:adenylate cyclase